MVEGCARSTSRPQRREIGDYLVGVPRRVRTNRTSPTTTAPDVVILGATDDAPRSTLTPSMVETRIVSRIETSSGGPPSMDTAKGVDPRIVKNSGRTRRSAARTVSFRPSRDRSAADTASRLDDSDDG
jgi:hypothetical protein